LLSGRIYVYKSASGKNVIVTEVSKIGAHQKITKPNEFTDTTFVGEVIEYVETCFSRNCIERLSIS